MPFNTYSFLLLLIPGVSLFWALPPAARRWYVLALSLAYYAMWNAAFLAVPLLLCAGVHLAARQGPRCLWGGIAFVLAMFIVFRAPLTATVPAGISFYAFAAIAYLIDNKQGRIQDGSFTKLFRFVMFWPTLIAGPILRFRELSPQLGFTKPFELSMLLRGMDRLVLGLVQKNFIANTLSGWVDQGFLPNAVRANTTLDNWALAIAFGLEIYFDFAAYSNMAIGTAQLIGVALPENFRFPYHAASPPDFWSRWHMTLSRWVRDYLFFPVNARFKAAPVPLYASLLGIMALVGLWHGAGWGFVLWGAMHGAYLTFYRIWENLSDARMPGLANSRLAAWWWRIFTLMAVTAAWVPFRAATGADTFAMLASMFGRWRFGISYGVNFYLVTLMVAAFCVVEPYVGSAWSHAASWMEDHPAARYLLRPLAYAAGLMLFLIFDDRSKQFIYFQF